MHCVGLSKLKSEFNACFTVHLHTRKLGRPFHFYFTLHQLPHTVAIATHGIIAIDTVTCVPRPIIFIFFYFSFFVRLKLHDLLPELPHLTKLFPYLDYLQKGHCELITVVFCVIGKSLLQKNSKVSDCQTMLVGLSSSSTPVWMFSLSVAHRLHSIS